MGRCETDRIVSGSPTQRVRIAQPADRAIVESLRPSLKPKIPATGDHGIPIRDELELESFFRNQRSSLAPLDISILDAIVHR